MLHISQEYLIITEEAWAGEQSNFVLFCFILWPIGQATNKQTNEQINPGNPVNPISGSASTLICSYILLHYILYIYIHLCSAEIYEPA